MSDNPIILPEGAMAVMVSEHYDDSDSMSDYFNRHAKVPGTTQCIALVKKGARREAMLRKAVQYIPQLATVEFDFKKDTYSMGHGVYLEAKSSHREYEGHTTYGGKQNPPVFYEVSFELYDREVIPHQFMVDLFRKPDIGPKEVKEPETIGNPLITRNEQRQGIEIKFPGKPGRDVLDFLKHTLRARWHFKKKIWYCKYTEARMALLRAKLA